MARNHRTAVIGVRLTPREVERLDKLCEQQDLSRSSLVRKLIKRFPLVKDSDAASRDHAENFHNAE